MTTRGTIHNERFNTGNIPNWQQQVQTFTSTTTDTVPKQGVLTDEQESMLLFGPNSVSIPGNPYFQSFAPTRVGSDFFEIGEYIRTVILTLITKNQNSLVQKVLPFRRFSGNPNVRVDVLEFSDNRLDNVPEKGVIRYMTSRETSTQHTIERRGIGFQMEDGYMKSKRGKQDYAYNIIQIQNAVVTNAARMIIEALLHPGPVVADWYQKMGVPYNEPVLDEIFSWECAIWGVLNKTKFGLGHLISRAREVMSMRQVAFDTLIVPFNSSEIYRRKHPEELSFHEMGNIGPKRRLASEWPGEQFGGIEILESPKFSNGPDEAPQDPTVRARRTHGEFFFMGLQHIPNPNKQLYTLPDALDIKILDCDTDSVVRVRYEDALLNSGIFDEDGKPTNIMLKVLNLNSMKDVVGDYLTARGAPSWLSTWKMQEKTFNTFEDDAALWRRIQSLSLDGAFTSSGDVAGCAPLINSDKAIRLIADFGIIQGIRDKNFSAAALELLLGMNLAEDVIIEVAQCLGGELGMVQVENLTLHLIRVLWQLGVYFPISVLLARPHMAWEMGSCIALKKGLETGATMIGNEDFSVFNNTRKVLEGNFTLHMGSIVYEPKNVLVLHNAFCRAYHGGGGVRFFNHDNDKTAYLSGTNNADIFALAVPYGYRPMSRHMDLTGMYPPELLTDRRSATSGPHYPSHQVYNAVWGWGRHAARRQLDIEYGDLTHVLNTRCWQGTQFNMDSDGKVSKDKIVGCGHWGPYVYGGVVADRIAAASGTVVRAKFEHGRD